LYGFNDRFISCIDFDSGDRLWTARGYNHGALTVADGKLIILGERGTLALAEASPDEFNEISSFRLFDGKTWTVPTVAGGRLYARNDEEIVCLDLRP
jgi:hypothetical protein